MTSDKNNLFLTLLKLKSYLASMIDERSNLYNNFDLTRQYLEKKYPKRKDEIINLLEDNEIYSDSEIAFNEKIIFKFRAIAGQSKNRIDLVKFLKNLDVDAGSLASKDAALTNYLIEREKKFGEILDILFQLATNWTILKELEDKADDFSILDEEEMIRPEEEKNLDAIDSTTSKAFILLSGLTKRYIEKLTDYYFTYGGNVALKDFVEELDNIKKIIAQKYLDLFKQNGLEIDWLQKLSS